MGFSNWVEKVRCVLCRIIFKKLKLKKNIYIYTRAVRKRLVEFFALDSNLPRVNTRHISTQLSCKQPKNWVIGDHKFSVHQGLNFQNYNQQGHPHLFLNGKVGITSSAREVRGMHAYSIEI